MIPTLLDDFEGFKTSSGGGNEHKIKIARELELEVEPEDILGSLQCRDKILTDEEMFLQLVQFSHSVVSNSL